WNAYNQSLEVLKEKFADYKASPYRRSHSSELCEAIIDISKQKYILQKGLNEDATDSNPRVWWVNQGKSYKNARNSGYLWAPQTNKQGRPEKHHEDLVKAREDDIVIAYSEGSIRSICNVKKVAYPSELPKELDSDA